MFYVFCACVCVYCCPRCACVRVHVMLCARCWIVLEFVWFGIVVLAGLCACRCVFLLCVLCVLYVFCFVFAACVVLVCVYMCFGVCCGCVSVVVVFDCVFVCGVLCCFLFRRVSGAVVVAILCFLLLRCLLFCLFACLRCLACGVFIVCALLLLLVWFRLSLTCCFGVGAAVVVFLLFVFDVVVCVLCCCVLCVRCCACVVVAVLFPVIVLR